MGNRKLYILFSIIAYLFCIGAPAITTLLYFPLFVEQSASNTFSGAVMFILILCAVPLFNALKKVIKRASVKFMWLFWLFLFGVLFLLEPIIDKVIIVSLVGAVGGGISIIFFAIARRYKPIEEVIRE